MPKTPRTHIGSRLFKMCVAMPCGGAMPCNASRFTPKTAAPFYICCDLHRPLDLCLIGRCAIRRFSILSKLFSKLAVARLWRFASFIFLRHKLWLYSCPSQVFTKLEYKIKYKTVRLIRPKHANYPVHESDQGYRIFFSHGWGLSA